MLRLIIYIDVIVLLNLFINSVILFLTAKLSQFSCSGCRILLGSALSSAVVVFNLLYPEFGLYSPFMKLALSAFIVAVVYQPRCFRLFMRLLVIFYVISFCMAGCVMSLYSFNAPFVLGYDGEFTLAGVMGGVIVAGMVIYGYVSNLLASRRLEKYLHEVRMAAGGRTVSAMGYLDTGNFLCAPGSALPVIIAEYQTVEPLLSSELAAYLRNTAASDWAIGGELLYDGGAPPVYFIPYQGVGVRDVLLGVKMDEVVVGEAEVDCIVALSAARLSAEDKYTVLLHADFASILR